MVDKRYLAGFIDGEGYISIVKHKDIRLKKGYTLCPIFRIGSSNRQALEEINQFIKGNIKSNGIDENTKHKQVYIIDIGRIETIRAILKLVVPYLIIKKQQAELMIDFCNRRLKAKVKNYSDKDFEIAFLFSKLNKRGNEGVS